MSTPIDLTNPGRNPGECGLCGKPDKENGACEEHIQIFTAVIENAVELAQAAGLTEDEEVGFVTAHIARHLKNEALKYARPGEVFSPDCFKVIAVETLPS